MTVLKTGNITIHTENIFPIIKKSLYTNHEIFLRELISNAVDAIAKLKMAAFAGDYQGEPEEPEIKIAVDAGKKTLSVTDNGIGMTAEEIEKYINQVAFSSAEEFVQKYKESQETIIGQFGLGFYSAFMVAEKVEIDTLSFKEGAEAVHWSCDGSPEFTLESSDRTRCGTTITLTLLDEEKEYIEPQRIRQLVKTYCDFMPVAIKFDNEIINKQRALWKESPQNLSKDDYLEFYRYLYPFEEDPLLWIHLNTDYPFVLNGILFFPKLKPDVEVSRGQIKLFCNQVFVSDNCEEVVPEFLMPLRGTIDSTDIPLNVSRSALTANRTVRRIADYIAKKIGDRLKSLSSEDPKEYIRCWQDVGTYVKYGSLKDEKFKKQVEDLIIYRSTATVAAPEASSKPADDGGEGDAWAEEETKTGDSGLTVAENGDAYTTLQSYLDRNQARHENRVFYCSDPSTQATYVRLYQSQGLEVLYLDSFIDANYFAPFLEKEHSNLQFVRVDAELDKTLLEDEQKAEIVDPQTNKTRSESIKELFERALNNPKINIRAEALKSDDQSNTPPAMVLLPEAMRRLKEMIALSQQQDMGFPEEHTLIVNTAHPLVQNIFNLSQGSIVQASGEASPSAQLAEQLCLHVYDLALVAQKGFGADDLKSFIQRSNQVLTNLTQK